MGYINAVLAELSLVSLNAGNWNGDKGIALHEEEDETIFFWLI